MMESLLRDPKMQEAMYQYLPENMRNKETFEWMMSNPQYREQLKEMMSKQAWPMQHVNVKHEYQQVVF